MSSKAQHRGSDYRQKRKRFHANQYTRKVSDTLDVDCISASAKKICKENYLDKEVRNFNQSNGYRLINIDILLPELSKYIICLNCNTKAVLKEKILYEIPAHLPTLDLVSERHISPRTHFMQIKRLRHVYGQFGILGKITSVPVYVNTMINRLTRNVDVDYCFCVHIKWQETAINRRSYRMGLITKKTIKAWLQYLVTIPLYRMYEVTIEDCFIKHQFNFIRSVSQVPQDEIRENIAIEESLTAQQHTLLWNEKKYLRIASGEATVQRSLLFNEHAEKLCIPAINFGHFRNLREGVRVTTLMMAKSDLRCVDRFGVTRQLLLYVAIRSCEWHFGIHLQLPSDTPIKTKILLINR
ncbi:helitron_like_N domain-containing protein [Trichonephila clavipes]|nr:helitron_like_N domain-containing protein [Trichonephila clavipes]